MSVMSFFAMLSMNGLADKYGKLDGNAKEKEAYKLIVDAEKALDAEEDAKCFETATKAVEKLKSLGNTLAAADATRLAVLVKIFQEDRKEAAQLAKAQLAECEAKSDKKGKARMLLSLAECNCDRRGPEKRELSIEQATEAKGIFQAEGEKKMEANALITLASAHMKRKGDKVADAAIAVDYASEALKLSRSIGDKKGEAQGLHAFAVSTVQTALVEPSMCFRILASDPTFEEGLDAAKAALEMWDELGCPKSAAFERQCISQWELLAGQSEEAVENAEAAAKDAGKGHKAYAQNMLVQAHLAQGNTQAGVEIAQKALKDAQSSGDKRGEAIALDALMFAYKAQESWDEALHAAEEVLECNRDADDLANEARTQGQIVNIYMDKQDLSLASEAADEMLRISEELGNPQPEAFARQKVADILLAKGEFKKAMAQYKLMEKLFEAANDDKGQAMTYLDESNAYIFETKYDDALGVAIKAQEIYKDHGDKTGEANALKLITQLYQYLDDAEAALKGAVRLKSLLRSVGDKRGEAQASCNVAHARLWCNALNEKSGLSRDSKDFHDVWCRAEREARDGMSLAFGLQDPDLIATAHYTLAQVYVATNGHATEALAEAVQAADMYKAAGNTKAEAKAQVVLGHANFLDNNTDKATEAMQEAFGIFQQIQDDAGQQMCLRAMQAFSGPTGAAAAQFDFGAADAQQVHAAPAGEVAAAAPGKISVEDIVVKVTTTIQDITQLDEELPADIPLMQAGLTSNATVLLRNQLSEAFPSVHVPFTLAFDYPSIQAVADFINEGL